MDQKSFPFSTSKLDTHNRNGDLLCHAFGCRKHKYLIKAFNGFFCKKHYEEIKKIRQIKGYEETIDQEIQWRMEEALLRKKMEPGHMYRIIKIEKQYHDVIKHES